MTLTLRASWKSDTWCDWDNYDVCIVILNDWSTPSYLVILFTDDKNKIICDVMSYFGDILSELHFVRETLCVDDILSGYRFSGVARIQF